MSLPLFRFSRCSLQCDRPLTNGKNRDNHLFPQWGLSVSVPHLFRIGAFEFRGRMPLSSRNSSGSASRPCSHMREKNQIPLSPMQKSAGVKAILESSGGSGFSGLYSAGQPKASPFQGFPCACKLAANFLTLSRVWNDNGHERVKALMPLDSSFGDWHVSPAPFAMPHSRDPSADSTSGRGVQAVRLRRLVGALGWRRRGTAA